MPSSINYFIYVRKSSDGEDRQALSNPDQIFEIQKIVDRKNLRIVDIIQETKTAKKPGRKHFNMMLKRIRKGEAQGILCWKLNRLARNPVDGGEISWMLQEGVIQHIRSCENEYFPEDNVLLMLVEFGVANQYSKDLAADVKRGMRRKAQRGWYPGAVLPIGYMHNPQKEVPEGGDKIVIDPIRFPLVKRLWQLMGTGEYTLPQIYEKAQVLGLRNKKGKTFSINTIRNLFEKSFYAGTFHWRDENKEIFEVEGKHIKMITPKLFHRVQGILHGNSKPTRLNKQNIRYKGVIQCGNCFSSVCGDKKLQVICSVCKHKFSRKNRDSCPQCLTQIKKMKKPTLLEYTYYRCTRRRNNCAEVALKEEVLEKQIISIFENIKINEAYYRYLLELLKESNKDRSDFKNQKRDFQRRIQSLDKKLVSYGDLRADNEITAEEYKKVKKRFSEEKMKLEKELRKLKYDDSVWIQDIDSIGKLMLKAKKVFQEDDDMKKNEVLSSFRSNLLVKQKKLYFPMLSTFSVIGKGFEVYSAYFGALEPEKSLDIYRSFGVFNDLNAILLAIVNKARN